MAKRTSRYARSVPFEPDSLGRHNFTGLMPRIVGPATGVLEHRVVDGERMDQLGMQFFNDDRRWWRVADANRNFLCATDITATNLQPEDDPFDRTNMSGTTILIPAKEE